MLVQELKGLTLDVELVGQAEGGDEIQTEHVAEEKEDTPKPKRETKIQS